LNRLTRDGSRAMVYDGAGYLTSLAGTTLTWDCLGNLTAHGSDTYSYDADNLRIKKIESSTTTYYIRNGLQELAEYGTGNELLAEYIYGNGRKMVKVDPERGYLWYYTDHLGSTRLMTGNDTSDVEQRRDYKPFGDTQTSSGNNESAYQFTQKELDSNTGLYYFGARYYDPSIGRFISVDPLAEKYPGWSPYVYALDNPLIVVDPDGRDVILIHNDVRYLSTSGSGIGKYSGHNALLVGNENAGWQLFSKDGEKLIIAGEDKNRVGDYFNSLTEFAEKESGYSEGVRFKTTEKQDAELVYTASDRFQKEYKINDGGNCADACADALNSIDINISKPVNITIINNVVFIYTDPTKQFEEALVNENAERIYFKKSP
jgi:RHS repeat-associated protein